MRPTIPAVFAVLLCATAAPAADEAPESFPAERRIAGADTLWVITEPVVVYGSTTSGTTDPAASSVDAIVLGAQDLHAAADLAPVLPATRAVVNSRGESVFMVRGASERHVRLWLDGIPLNVPWDERVDAGLVPVDAIGSVRGVRGAGSVLEGPNALAGTIELRPQAMPADGARTRLGAQFGESVLREGRLLHQRRQGAWEVLAAGSWRAQDGYVVPAGLEAPVNQGPSRQRLNSDLEQASLLLRLQRRSAAGAVWHVTFLGADGEKGVPPETHLGADARFWRYPSARRGLLGAGLRTPLGGGHVWELVLDAAADVSHLEIRAFDDATYTTPAVAPGVDYETDDDRTGFARARAVRYLDRGSLAVQTSARYARHRESLQHAGPELDYAQFLGAAAVEADLDLGRSWRTRAGGGWDLASTPESGDKPARDATGAAAAFARLERRLGEPLTLHASYARRSRFPALRELYSGALGRFVPNPGLAPEVQDLWDLGAVGRRGAWELGLTGFASYLDGAIERTGLGDGTNRFQRVNLDAVRTLGVEAVATWRPSAAWEIGGHHSVIEARRLADGRYDGAVEDRPSYVSFLSAAWRRGGWQATVEGMALGPRMSADVTDAGDGLKRLPAQGTVNLRLARAVTGGMGPLSRGAVHLRVDNVFDALVESQTGLPLAGRTVVCGFEAWFEARPAD
ncbi:MAG: TonB-dependent receptor [bacterium]|nr:TonB-dependent receptor [bacterium]